MQNKSPSPSIVFFLLIWPLFTGCYSYIAATPPSFYDGPEEKSFKNLKCEYETQLEQNYFESLICHSRSQLDHKFTYQLASDSDLRVEGFDPQDKDEALKAPLLLRFVWFSDVQFRQRELRLGSDFFSRFLDYFISTAERNRAQEDFHWAVYFSQIGRLVELRGTPGGPVWLVSRALWSTFMPLRERPGDDVIKPVFDDCLQKEKRDAKRETLAEAVRCGHYGAVADYRKDKSHFWQESPQPFREAWNNANVIIPVSR
jgi:hypothetical protein